jgi:hypothetical protein
LRPSKQTLSFYGNVICVEYMLFNGYLIATGGNGSYPGGPGTVYVQSDVGTDRWRELWIDNLNRGNLPDKEDFLYYSLYAKF